MSSADTLKIAAHIYLLTQVRMAVDGDLHGSYGNRKTVGGNSWLDINKESV